MITKIAKAASLKKAYFDQKKVHFKVKICTSLTFMLINVFSVDTTMYRKSIFYPWKKISLKIRIFIEN